MVELLVCWSGSRLVSRSVGRSVSWLVILDADWSVGQWVGWSLSRSVS
jgi:hypothetical protein